jgi:hypothetical protein
MWRLSWFCMQVEETQLPFRYLRKEDGAPPDGGGSAVTLTEHGINDSKITMQICMVILVW